jgi:hypothetical protein
MNKKKTFPKKKTTEDVAVATETIVASPAEVEFKVPPMPKKTIKNPFVNPSFGKKSEKPVIFQLIGGKRIPGTNKKQHPIVSMMKAEDIIFDPIKGVNRKIRYIPGESSIYEDEQKENAKVKSPIIFTEGVLVVNNQNPTLVNYLDNCNSNKNNPNRMKDRRATFERVDKSRDAKAIINKELKEIDAMSLALKMPISKLIGYAKVLGVNVEKSTEEIRYDMRILAKKSPMSFIAGLDNPMTSIKEVILNAQDYAIILMEPNRVSWKKGDQTSLICHVPIGKKPLDHFAGFCIDKEGQLVLAEMKKQIDKFNS